MSVTSRLQVASAYLGLSITEVIDSGRAAAGAALEPVADELAAAEDADDATADDGAADVVGVEEEPELQAATRAALSPSTAATLNRRAVSCRARRAVICFRLPTRLAGTHPQLRRYPDRIGSTRSPNRGRNPHSCTARRRARGPGPWSCTRPDSARPSTTGRCRGRPPRWSRSWRRSCPWPDCPYRRRTASRSRRKSAGLLSARPPRAGSGSRPSSWRSVSE